jgi:rod shape-determining protein MreC
MRNIFLFIRRYSNFVLFIVLQIIALYFLFTYNKTHEAAFMGVAGEVTGRVSEKYNGIEYYFKLKKTNEALVQENVRLRQMLRENYEAVDTASKIVVDSIRIDSLLKFQKYQYLQAKVVGSFVSTQTNYYTIHRGANQGVKRDMGVISPMGIVGRVTNTSANFATVMSLLNRQFKVDAKLKKTGDRGSIEWQGDNTQFVIMRNIPKSTRLIKGDTVLTSELSSIFPPNIMVGFVESILQDESSNFFTLKLKTANNFFNVQYVYVVENLQLDERKELEKNTKGN